MYIVGGLCEAQLQQFAARQDFWAVAALARGAFTTSHTDHDSDLASFGKTAVSPFAFCDLPRH